MTNAFKYAFAGRSGGMITLQCLRRPDGYLVVVADNGIGLPEGSAWPTPGKISALIVQSLRESVKASVNVTSVPQGGTNISILVPAAQAAPGPDLNWQATTKTKTVLVVDDDQDVLEMVGAYLKRTYRVLTATDGTEALAKLAAEGAVDLILADIVMPGGMDGFEVARRANKLQPHIRVLYMSGFMKSIPAEANGVIYDRFLKKPFRLDELETELTQAFAKQRPFEAHA
jgi:CheY-like chemotaxis protein